MTGTTGLEGYYSIKNNKKMRYGYTTGSCAAGAAKAAAFMLLLNKYKETESLMTPKGILLSLKILDITRGENWVSCAVEKDAGDDPDVTHGLKIFAKVEKISGKEIIIDGGVGVGRVTKKGLEQPVGSAAINKVPRAMIQRALEEICSQADYEGGLLVTISVPKGEQTAARTFNPRLGIEGGISILGTSGIVEPMSEAALIKSIEVEMRQKVENGAEYLLVTPGNYGVAYIKEHMNLPFSENMKCCGRNSGYGCGYGGKRDSFYLSYRKVCEGSSRNYEYPFPLCGWQSRNTGRQRPKGRNFHGRGQRNSEYHYHR